MNAFSQIATAYEPVSYADWSYVMTPADFPNGCFTRTINGRSYGYGENKLGVKVSVPLNVRLCRGCDQIISQHLCTSCNLVFVGDGE